VFALEQLMQADMEDRVLLKDVRDAIWLIGGIKRKSDVEKEAVQAVQHAFDMLKMFETEVAG
jgi:hypothetical protein